MPVDAITRRLMAVEALKKARAVQAEKRAARIAAGEAPPPKVRRKVKRRRGSGKVRRGAAATVATSSKPAGARVTFTCPTVPALGIGLPGAGLIAFQHGKLTLDDPDDIALMRKHIWFGSKILEVKKDGAGDDAVPGAGDGPVAVQGAETQPSAPPAASRPDGGAMALYKKFLVRGEAGGFRCSLCQPVSPTFPTEAAAIQHVFRSHSSEEVKRG